MTRPKTVVATIKIERCTSCPFVDYDENITFHKCNKMGGQKLFATSENEDNEPIPDWCPLPQITKR